MELFNTICLKLKRYLLDTSLLRKLTLAYTVAILIPVAIIGFYSYSLSQKSVQEEFIKSSRQRVLQIEENINIKTLIARNIVEDIAFNYRIQRFLQKRFVIEADMILEYKDIISPLIDHAESYYRDNLYDINIFMSNRSIPEYWNNFFSEERIRKKAWYQEFIGSSKDSEWMYPLDPRFFEGSIKDKTEDLFTLVKKIKASDGSQIGIITLGVKKDNMFLAMEKNVGEEDSYLVVDNRNEVIYSSGSNGLGQDAKHLTNKAYGASGYFIEKDILFTYKTIDSLNIKIIGITPIGKMLKNSRATSMNMLLIVCCGVLVLEGFTYILLRIIFQRLNRAVKVMNSVAGGTFNIQIPDDGNDEVGQLIGDFNKLIKKINEQVADLVQKESDRKDAQLMALQYQINPHFIFNSMNCFQVKMEMAGDYETAEAITHFAEIFRYNISDHTMYATIRQEIKYVEHYIKMQKIRFDEGIVFTVDCPEEILDMEIIKFVLQPIVENSIKYGIPGITHLIEIKVQCRRAGENVEFIVSDNGSGIDKIQLEEMNVKLRESHLYEVFDKSVQSIGLLNINNRLKLFYGNEYYCRLESEKGKFSRTILNVPFIEERRNRDV